MSETNANKELEVFQRIVSGLSEFEKETKVRIIQSVITFMKLDGIAWGTASEPSSRQVADSLTSPVHSFKNTSTVDPKQFLVEKMPHTDVERVACLAYYLAQYRETPHFTTLEISKLNTEAAQPKFANTAQTLKNAATRGFIVSGERGKKQLSSTGEQFVQVLPDRDLAKQLLQRFRSRKSRKSMSMPGQQVDAPMGRKKEKA